MGLPVGTGNAQVIVTGAAANRGIPAEILWGVFGVETGWGSNVVTSSAGAQGPFQFIPSTAKAYNYPLTNNPNVNEFQKQADAAAHYLSDLHKKFKNWPDALAAYNAGPDNYKIPAARKYAADVLAKGKQGPPKSGGVLGAVGGVGSAIKDAEGAIPDVPKIAFDGLKAIGAFFAALLQKDTWIRILKVMGGLGLIAFGINQLTGASPTKTIGKALPVL